MKVVEADWTEMLPILAENQDIWGAGLSPQLYRYYSAQQFYKPWFKRNCHYYVLKVGGAQTVVAGLKLYSLSLSEKGKQKALAGIGAVYTLEAFRGNGYANKLLKQVLSMCRKNEVSAVLLFSDIGTEFYEPLDFKPLPALSYLIDVNEALEGAGNYSATAQSSGNQITAWPAALSSAGQTIAQPTALKIEHLDLLSRIYNRSKVLKSSHVERSMHHWQYKVWREEFLHTHSKLNWPGICLLVSPDQEAYLLYEYSHKTLRVLELVGKEPACLYLWSKILEIAKDKGFSQIRSWQAGLPPGLTRTKPHVRDWGHPMIHTFDKDLVLPKLDSFPLLELDYF